MGVSLSRRTTEKHKEGNERTNSTEFITVSALFTCQYFTHKDFFKTFFFLFFHFSTLAAVSYFTKLTAKNIAGPVTQRG